MDPHRIRLARPWRRTGGHGDSAKAESPADQPVTPGTELSRRFHRPTLDRGERVVLRLSQLPAKCDAFLNGERVGDGDDVTDRLEPFNELSLRYAEASPVGASDDVTLLIFPPNEP